MGAKGRLIAVCISENKGERKHAIPKGELRAAHGLVGDSHAGTGRQVSLLADESIEKMRTDGLTFKPGDFAENLTTSGIELHTLPVGTHLRVGSEVLLEVTQIGKQCHADCEIMRLAGRCIMPKEGIFVRVLTSGEIKAGDDIEVLEDARDESSNPHD